MDATGLGAPVLEMLRNASLGCQIVPVIITGGERETGSGGMWRVPKRDLINRLQIMFERKELKIAGRLREADHFARELMSMRVKLSVAGHDSYAAGRESDHDDLVVAVALACWRAKGPLSRPVWGTRSLGLC